MDRIGKLAFAVVLSVGSFSVFAVQNDRICIQRGIMGQAFADLKASGNPEKEAIRVAGFARDQNIKEDPSPKSKRSQEDTYKKNVRIIEYLYTVNLKSEDAREMVYLKCKAGDFD